MQSHSKTNINIAAAALAITFLGGAPAMSKGEETPKEPAVEQIKLDAKAVERLSHVEDLRHHSRMAKIDRLVDIAKISNKEELKARTETIKKLEERRHKGRMEALAGKKDSVAKGSDVFESNIDKSEAMKAFAERAKRRELGVEVLADAHLGAAPAAAAGMAKAAGAAEDVKKNVTKKAAPSNRKRPNRNQNVRTRTRNRVGGSAPSGSGQQPAKKTRRRR